MKPLNIIIVTGIIALISTIFFFISFKRWSSSNYRHFQIVVSGNKIINGSATLTVNQGDDVDMDAVSDKEEELYIADYGLSIKLQGVSTGMIFNAVRPGNFPIQLKEELKDGKLKTTDVGVLIVNSI